NKMPVGKSHDDTTPFTMHELNLQKGDTLYLVTDGYADQFGGPKGKKFKYKQLQEEILKASALSTSEQKEKLSKVFEDWKGALEQVDDVCIVGLKV
ncbi:MAG TPA: SpoIIE family protein phosphatase, partial [Bacteroidia bacterium]|nr:SpoIIE family protein phosphatase [Bacteroidia bacterium]